MTFTQSRSYDGFGIDYNVEYSPIEDGNYDRLEATMHLRFSDDWIFPLDFAIHEPDNLIVVAKSVVDKNEENQAELSLEIAVNQSVSGEKFILEISDDTGHTQDLHIKFPSSADLQLIDLLSRDEVPLRAIDLLQERYDLNDLSYGEDSIFTLINTLPWALNIEGYFELFNTFSQRIDWFRAEIGRNIHATFRNIINGESIGKYYGVTDINELKHIISVYNHQPRLREYPFSEFIGVLIMDLVSDRGNRDLPFMIDSGVNQEFPLNELSLTQFHTYLSLCVNSRNLEFVRTILTTHVEGVREISDFYEAAEEAGNIRDYEDRAAAFSDLLRPAAQDLESPFRYILSNALFWHARYLYTVPRDQNDVREVILKAVIGLTSGTSFEWIHDWATYEINWICGARHVSTNPEQAVKHFRKAVMIAANDSNAWGNSRFQNLVPALGRQTEAEAEVLREGDRYEEAIDLLEERKNLISELEDVSSEDQEYWTTILDGHMAEVEAIIHYEKYQFELALESFNRAAGAFNEAGNEGLFVGVVGRRYQIQALLAEVEGDFEEAADLHGKYVETLPSSAGAPYHRARQVVCEAKALLLDDELNEAKSRMLEFRESNTVLNPSQERFSLLIDAALDYKEKTVTDLSSIVDSVLSGVDHDIDTLVKFSDDYTTGFLTVLSAQRLHELPVPGEFLDELVQLALEEACYPQNATEMGAEPSYSRNRLRRISMDTEWRLILPRYVLDELEKVRTAKQTTFDDFSGLARDLVVPLEQHLAVFVEYHGKRIWGDEWKTNIPNEEPFSLGDYIQFFNTDEVTSLPCYEAVSDSLDTGVSSDKPVVQLRNALGHGKNPGFSETGDVVISENHFEQLHEEVTALMEAMSADTSVLATVENSFGDSYKVRLHWSNYIKRTWVTSEVELDTETIYHMPQSKVTQEDVHLDSIDVIECSEERAQSHIL